MIRVLGSQQIDVFLEWMLKTGPQTVKNSSSDCSVRGETENEIKMRFMWVNMKSNLTLPVFITFHECFCIQNVYISSKFDFHLFRHIVLFRLHHECNKSGQYIIKYIIQHIAHIVGTYMYRMLLFLSLHRVCYCCYCCFYYVKFDACRSARGHSPQFRDTTNYWWFIHHAYPAILTKPIRIFLWMKW